MKATLPDTYIYLGKFYGPGEVDLPDEVHKALKEKGVFGKQKSQQPAEQPDRLETTAVLIDHLGFDLGTQLAAAGYDSEASIRAASDDDLLALDGVGPATLRKIRMAVE